MALYRVQCCIRGNGITHCCRHSLSEQRHLFAQELYIFEKHRFLSQQVEHLPNAWSGQTCHTVFSQLVNNRKASQSKSQAQYSLSKIRRKVFSGKILLKWTMPIDRDVTADASTSEDVKGRASVQTPSE